MTDQNPQPVTDEAIQNLPQEYHSIVEVFAPSHSTVRLLTVDGEESTVPVVHLPVRCFTQAPGDKGTKGQQVTIITVPLDVVQEVVAGLALGFSEAAKANGVDISKAPPSPTELAEASEEAAIARAKTALRGGYL